MIERAIANWLANTVERSFQLPFCQVLVSQGHKVIYISKHGLMEQGKDIISVAPTGEVHAYQLKTGDISLGEWRLIRHEVEECAEIPIVHPSISAGSAHRSFIVTNGEIGDPVRFQITQINERNAKRGIGSIETITGHELLGLFIDAQGSFLPREIREYELFLKLHLSDGRDFLPCAQFFELVNLCFMSEIPKTKKQRLDAISSSAVLTSYALQSFQLAGNHYAQFQAWTALAGCVARYAARAELSYAETQASLSLIESEIERHLDNLADEALEREDYLEGDLDGDGGIVYKARTTLVIGALALKELLRCHKSDSLIDEDVKIAVLKNFDYLWMWGDSAIPPLFAVLKFLEFAGEKVLAEKLLIQMITHIVDNAKERDLALVPPYFSAQKVLMHLLTANDDDDFELFDFSGESYSLWSLVCLAARRGFREKLSGLWRSVSHISSSEFRPKNDIDWFLWECLEGDTISVLPAARQSWSELVRSASEFHDCPKVVKENPKLAFEFLFVAPHRAFPSVLTFLDEEFGNYSTSVSR